MTCCFSLRRLSRYNINNNCYISRRCCDIYRQSFVCDISLQQCDIYQQWGLRRFQQIATLSGDGASISLNYDVSRRCDISRRYNDQHVDVFIRQNRNIKMACHKSNVRLLHLIHWMSTYNPRLLSCSNSFITVLL